MFVCLQIVGQNRNKDPPAMRYFLVCWTASTRFANFSQNLVFLSVNRNFAARRGFRFSSLSLYKRTFGRFHIRNKLCGTLFCFVIAPLVTSKPFEKEKTKVYFLVCWVSPLNDQRTFSSFYYSYWTT